MTILSSQLVDKGGVGITFKSQGPDLSFSTVHGITSINLAATLGRCRPVGGGWCLTPPASRAGQFSPVAILGFRESLVIDF